MSAIKRSSQRIFSGLAGSYERAVDLATVMQDRRWKTWIAERIGDGGDPILDVGCGTLLLEERLAVGGRRFVGLDLSREMLGVGSSKGLGNVELVVNGDAEALPFPDGSFQQVLSCYVAKYVKTTKFAAELSRVTREGGTVALYDFAKPRGPLAPFLEMYIQGGLRGVAFLLALARRDSAFTYANLPRIIDATTWDHEIVAAMERSGFETLSTKRLTGGAAFAYHGRKRNSP